MLSVCSIVTAMILQSEPGDPIGRAIEFVSSSQGIAAEYEYQLNDRVFQTLIERQFPNSIRLKIEHPTEAWSFTQTPSTRTAVNLRANDVYEFSSVAGISAPPPYGALNYAFPIAAIDPKGAFAKRENWKPLPNLNLNGAILSMVGAGTVPVESLSAPMAANGVTAPFIAIGVDRMGRVAFVRQAHELTQGFDMVEFRLKSARQLTAADPKIVDELPEGAKSAVIRRELTVPIVNDPVPAARVVVEGMPTDLLQFCKSSGALIFVTSDDCEPSKAGASAFATLAAEAKKAGAAVLHLSTGATNPAVAISGAKVGHPESGDILTDLPVSATPYVLVLDQTGRVAKAWVGYTKDGSTAMSTTLRSGFSQFKARQGSSAPAKTR